MFSLSESDVFSLDIRPESCLNSPFSGNNPLLTMKRKLGAVYTPEVLASWVASELLERLPKKNEIWILDPACGDGALLKGINRMSNRRANLCGVDVNPVALREAAKNLPETALLKCADALSPFSLEDVERAWTRLIGPIEIDAIISNPPWGAQLQQSSQSLRAARYELAKGQYDSFDIFVELCLRVATTGTLLAFILPDSIFFPEHKDLRSLLLARTQLRLVARLGEGLFGDVYRGTAVIVCEKQIPNPKRKIECFRLRKSTREKVLNGALSLASAKRAQAHLVPQKRFQDDPERRFDIDVSEIDLAVFRLVHQYRSNWANLLISGRGVELSKTGLVVICPGCDTARPEPHEGTVRCHNCGAKFGTLHAKRKKIIRETSVIPHGWKRLIVGEDVQRYRCDSSRVIDTNVRGINYKKSSSFESRKLLVRKTGVGIKAAIDESGAMTNQVVFHYRPLSKETPSFFLDYVLGVMCSRVMLAYHLKRTGESEWRSHPYVTQKTIAEFPIPMVSEGTWQWKQARAIADAVKMRNPTLSGEPATSDVGIDSLVAGLYGLDQRGCDWVLNVLNDAQSLESITSMRLQPGQLRTRSV